MHKDRFLIQAAIFSLFFGLSIWIMGPYVEAVIWGVLVAILAAPLYTQVKKLFENSAYPALAIVFLLVCIFLILFVVFSIYVSFEIRTVAAWIQQNGFKSIQLPVGIRELPIVGPHINAAWIQYMQDIDKEKILNIVSGVDTSWLMKEAIHGFTSLFRGIFLFFLVNLVLFFILKHEESLTHITDTFFKKNLTHWPDYKKTTVTCIRGIGFNFLLIGIGTGTLMTIVYSICGLPVPLILGAITAILTVIPFTFPIFYLLLSAFLLIQGEFVYGFILLGTAGAINIITDTWLQPYLISEDSKAHFLTILFGILGGVSTLGLKGIILGPLILSLFFEAILNYIHKRG